MRLNTFLVSGVLLCTSYVTMAQAAITTHWVQVPISPAALIEAPQLADMSCWDLLVTHTDGDWSFAGMRVELPGETYYGHPFSDGTLPNPVLIPLFPALEFTTYVTTPAQITGIGPTVIIDGFPSGPVSLGSPGSALPGVFSVSWGDVSTVPPGTYPIARLTFPTDIIPDIHDDSFTSQIHPDGSTLIDVRIPEPATIGWLSACVIMLVRCRRGC